MTEVAERRLDNGVRVLLIPRSGGLAAIQALLRVGSLHDPPGQEGLSHCLEHMLFKGSRRTSGVEMSRRFIRLGALPQAETMPDETFVSVQVPRRHAGQALGLLAELLGEPDLDPEDLEREKQVIRGEVLGIRDDLRWWLLSELLPRAVFGGWAGYPITGGIDTVVTLSVADLRRHHNTWYHGGNLVLAVVAEEPAALWPGIVATFGALPGAAPAVVAPVSAAGTGYGRLIERRPAELATLALGWRLPPVAEADLPALDLAISVLGEGTQSLIVSHLRGMRGMAYDAGAFRQRSLLADFAAVHAQVDPASVEAAVDLIRELVAAAGHGIDEEAVAAVRALAETAALEGSESSMHLASWYAAQAARGRRLESPTQRAERLRSVTGEHVAVVARRYLDPEHYAFALVGP